MLRLASNYIIAGEEEARGPMGKGKSYITTTK